MGLADIVARRPLAVIALWIVAAVASAPLAAMLDEVLVAGEEGFLPEGVESVRAARALEEAGVAAEPDAILVVEGVPVGLESYERLRPLWGQVEWGAEERVSWVDVADSIYTRALEAYREALASSVAALEGMESLWLAALNATGQMESLAALIDGLSAALAGAGEAYAGYAAALRQASQAAPQALETARGLAALCANASRAYAAVLFNVYRVEFYLENLTDAYQAGLGPEDVAAVLAAVNATPGLPPASHGLVALVYEYVSRAGGPGAFNSTLAAAIAAEAVAAAQPDAAGYARALAARVAPALAGHGDLRPLAASDPYRLYELVASAVAGEAAGALLDYASLLPAPARAAAEVLAAAGCSEDAVEEAAARIVAAALVEHGVPERHALEIARAAVEGSGDALLAARLALEAAAEAALASGAPAEVAALLNSTEAAELLVRLDPGATGELARNETLARLVAAELASEALGAPREAAVALALGASPEEVALDLLEAGAPPEAGPFIEALRASGIPRDRDGFLGLAAAVLERQASEAGAPDAGEVARAAVRVYAGEADLEEEAGRLAWAALERAWPRVLGELEGSLVGRDGETFLVLLYGASYEGAVGAAESLRGALEAAGYGGARVLATGGVVADREVSEAAVRDVERSDRVSMILVLVVLALVLESVVAVFLPFVGIGLALATAMAVVYLLAKADAVTVTTIARTVMFSTGLGLGIDYAALVARRFREELASTRDSRLAAARALRLSARPIAAGAATAAAGFGSLALAWDFPFLQSIGATVPVAIALVALAGATFTPALLALIGGSRILWLPGRPEARPREARALGEAVTRLAPLLLAAAAALLVPAAIVHAGFEGSHDLKLMMPEGTGALEALRLIEERFDPGVVYPLYVVSTSPEAAERVAGALETLDCIASADVRNTTPPVVVAVMAVSPLTAEGVDCAAQAREAAHQADPGSLVGGLPAVSLDLELMLNERFYGRVLPAAVALMTLSMLVAYGGLAMALAAVASIAVAAEVAIAATVAYYQQAGVEPPWFLPITVFTAILGVGMDYNSFMIARIAEECRRDCSRAAVARAAARASLLVLGLSLIMAGAYGGLTLSSIPNLRMMGAALALGVLLAGVMAAVALTPPTAALLGRHAWRPWGPRAPE